MKIEFKRSELLSAVNKINKIACLPKTNQMYDNIKIIATDSVVLKANNDLAFMTTNLKANIIEQGEICINSDDLTGIIRSINSDIITIEHDNLDVVIRCEESNIKLSAIAIDSFIEGPKPTQLTQIQSFEINNKELYSAFINCLPFENLKSLITGLNIKSQENSIRLCCCSEAGGCLYYINDIKFASDQSFDFTVDTKLLREFKEIFEADDIVLTIYNRLISIRTSDIELILRSLNKSYPKIEAIIPKEFKSELPLNILKTSEAFNLIDVITDKKDAYINYKKNKCIITHPEGVEFVINNNSSIEESIHIDRDLLRKALKLLHNENITLYYNDLPKPLIIEDKNKIFLISVLVK